jgi:DNA primase
MKDKPDLYRVLQACGVDLQNAYGKQTFDIWCPFHGDTPTSRDGKPGRPNLHVRLDRQSWKCYRCDRGGDVFDFVGMKTYGDGWNSRDKTQFKEVVRTIEGLLQITLSKPQPYPFSAKTKKEDEAPPPIRIQDRAEAALNVITFAAMAYNNCLLEQPAGKQALTYIRGRGISDKTLRNLLIGWAPGNLLSQTLSMYPPEMRDLAAAADLLRDDGSDYFRQRMIIPDRGRDGIVYYMTGRSLKKDDKLRYLGLKGGKTIWGIHRVSKQDVVFMVESPMDAVSLWQCGYQAVAVQGTGFDSQWDAQLLSLPSLVIIPQNDKAAMDSLGVRMTWKDDLPAKEGQGDEAGTRKPPPGWAERLPHAHIRRIPATYKDVNDILKDAGEDELKRVVEGMLNGSGGI